jgi:hypothetical protein
MLLSIPDKLDVADPSYNYYEASRLGGILYLAEIRRRFGVFPVWSTVQLRKLRKVLSAADGSWQKMTLWKLWIITIAALEATSDDERCFFGHGLKEIIVELGLRDHGDLNSALHGFLWIDTVHGARLKVLFSSWLNDI